MRRTLRTLALAPWRRAPLQGWRTPSLAIGVLVAATVLGLAGVSRPLFAASAARASLAQDLSDGCALEVGLRAERRIATPTAPDVGDELGAATAALDDAVAPVPGIDDAIVTVYGGTADVARTEGTPPGRVPPSVQVVQRDGFVDHVEVLDRADVGPGVWLTDTTAEPLGVGAGDEVVLRIQGHATTVPVVGVFRDLRVERDQWWCTMRYSFQAPSAGGGEPPPLVLVDDLAVVDLLAAADVPYAAAWWEYPPEAAAWDLATAQDATAALRGVADTTNNRATELFDRLGTGRTTVDRPLSVSKAERAETSVGSVAGPVALGAMGVALILLLAAARTWMQREAQEVTILSLRGAGPVLLSLKAVGELLPALLLGTATGIGAAVVVTRTLGPDPTIERDALVEGLVVVGLALVVALVAVAGVVAAGVRRVGVGVGGAAPRRTMVPWEPVVLALAAAALYEVQTRPPVADEARIDSLLLLFPLLLLTGGAGLAARLVLSTSLLPRLAPRAPGPVWLAARRLIAGRVRATLVVTGAAISIGIVVFSGATTASVRATAYAKATLDDGAAQVVRLSATQPAPTAPPLPDSTVVTRTTESSVVRAGHDRAEVLGVEPATFADGAYWDDAFADRSLDDLLDAVAVDDPATRPLPAIGVGDGLPDRFVVTLDGADGDVDVEVEVVARAEAFPGLGAEGDRPLVVVDRAALTAVGVTTHAEVWTGDDGTDVPERLEDEGLTVVFSRRPAASVEGTRLQPQVWAIQYLEVVGAAAGVVSVAGLGLHLAADGERRRLGAALARRLGMPRRQVAGATAVEVAALLAGGLVLGVGLAWVAVRLVFRQLDPLPRTDPEPLVRYDLPLVGTCALVCVVVGVVVTLAVEVRARRTSLPELVRAAR